MAKYLASLRRPADLVRGWGHGDGVGETGGRPRLSRSIKLNLVSLEIYK
jgi:hypothetical protein